jgi:hypothetical protein
MENKELIVLNNEGYLLNEFVSKELAILENEAKRIKEMQENYKKAILEEMEAKQIIKIETEEVSVSYVAPTDRETFDSKAFKESHQDLYDEYVKMTPVKSSIRIKVK